jgi:hypothetical protein
MTMSRLTDKLAELGIPMDFARSFLMANLDNPQLIFSVASMYDIDNAMLGELAGGYSDQQVEGFFAMHGIASAVLDERNEFFNAQDMPTQMLPLIHLNGGTGALATANLRTAVIAQVGQAAYDSLFDPTIFEGASDGTFSTAELGFSHLGALPATQATIESLFYGTVLSAFRSIDAGEQAEVNNVTNFVHMHLQHMLDGDEALFMQFVDMVMGVFDPADAPLMTETQLQEMAVTAAVRYVQIVGGEVEGDSLFIGMLTGFM